MNIKRIIWALFLFQATAAPSLARQTRAPESPTQGVVWEIPPDFREAAGDLLEMKEVGVQAVRTAMVFDDGLLSLADSLGLVLYRELPFRGLTARDLRDSLQVADSLVTLLLESGGGHMSAGPIGLTQFSDTSSDVACDEIDRVSQLIQNAGVETYYASLFTRDDACHDRVDFVLIDALTQEHPFERIDVWKTYHDTRVGIARMGVNVEVDAPSGFNLKGSSEAQARFFEDNLSSLSVGDEHLFFVHRWRDESEARHHVPDPYGRQFGLYTTDSEPRPALQVIRGFFLEYQTTFAFDRGEEPEPDKPWFSMLGWLLLALTALMYAGSPRFRSMIPRYFFAHGFFRNAVREAREVLPLTSTAILTVTGLSIGLIGSFVMIGLKETEFVAHIYRSLSQNSRISLTSVLDAPFVLAILLGSAALAIMSLWMSLWMIISGRSARLLPSQALMLAVWPRWQILFLLPLAMTLAASGPVPVWSIMALAAGWLGTAYWSTVRTAYDLYKITSLPIGPAVAVWLLNPLILGTIVFLGWALIHSDSTSFAWHLMVRS